MSISATALVALNEAFENVDHAAEGVRRATNQARDPQDQVDLSTAAVSLLVAQSAVDSAVALAKTADEISEATLDLLA